ncbi:hypothetical protein CDAR_508302 [Caerostris darwini]|nr:hypothetical protein CDAR_508302 [Caerostris darwini]
MRRDSVYLRCGLIVVGNPKVLSKGSNSMNTAMCKPSHKGDLFKRADTTEGLFSQESSYQGDQTEADPEPYRDNG